MPRNAYLFELLDPRLLGSEQAEILDVGLSIFVNLLRERYDVRVDTLDLVREEEEPQDCTPDGPERGRHVVFDLNLLEEGTMPQGLAAYDVVLFCEVLEHLRISPRHVFPFLAGLLKPGGIPVVQTPNAAAVGKRAKLLIGRNPYGPIGEDSRSPLHFREYTMDELRNLARVAGLVSTAASYAAYFDVRFRHAGSRSRLGSAGWQALYRFGPPTWRPGMTIVFERASSPEPQPAGS